MSRHLVIGGNGGKGGRGGPERKAAVFAVTGRGLEAARRIAGAMDGVTVYGPSEVKERGIAKLVERAFDEFGALVFVCASGIAVRSVAPLLTSKDRDPAVVVVDEAARYAISLVSGHLGGANRLARELGSILGAEPVVTTATDAMGLPCVEDIMERFSLRADDVSRIKAVNSAILCGGPVAVVDGDDERSEAMREAFGDCGVFIFGPTPTLFRDLGACVLITPADPPGLPEGLEDRTLVLRPAEFVLGVGCRRGVTVGEVETAVDTALEEAGISPKSVRNLASIDIKSNETGLVEFARGRGLNIRFYSALELERVAPPSGSSPVVMDAAGTGAVSEPAALLSAGSLRLWRNKKAYGKVTVAVAKAQSLSWASARAG